MSDATGSLQHRASFRRGLCLPSGSNLAEEELEQVVSVFRSCAA